MNPLTASIDVPSSPLEGLTVLLHPEQPEPTRSLAKGLLRLLRPKQWMKNVLVFAAAGSAGALLHLRTDLQSLGLFGLFCLAASGTYFVNDAIDAPADRLHPKKRFRPVASGAVPEQLALVLGAVMMVTAAALAFATYENRYVGVLILIYIVQSFAYCLWLKHVVVIEMVMVALGFFLRVLAGGVATHVYFSKWFLISASFGSLLIAAGKRSAELQNMGDAVASTRRVLLEYPMNYLRSVRLLSASVMTLAYCSWALTTNDNLKALHVTPFIHNTIWLQISIVPFAVAILHNGLNMELGRGDAPEELALTDRTLQVLGLIWIITVFLGIYA